MRNETRREQETSEKLHEKLQKCKGEQDFLKSYDVLVGDNRRFIKALVEAEPSLGLVEKMRWATMGPWPTSKAIRAVRTRLLRTVKVDAVYRYIIQNKIENLAYANNAPTPMAVASPVASSSIADRVVAYARSESGAKALADGGFSPV